MLEGSCHCGSVTWSYEPKIDGVTACNCTLCRRYGALWAYGHLGEGIEVSGATNAYARKINAYHFCRSCGGIAYYLAHAPNAEGRRRIAVNLRLVSDPGAIAGLPIDHFDGLDKFDDLPRDGRCVKDLWF